MRSLTTTDQGNRMNAVSDSTRPSSDMMRPSYGLRRMSRGMGRPSASRLAVRPQPTADDIFRARIDAAEAALSPETWARILAAA
jgi:hypothetical protein